jgi:hypothetical protein
MKEEREGKDEPVVIKASLRRRRRQSRTELLVVDEVPELALVELEEEEALVEVGEDGRKHVNRCFGGGNDQLK